LIILKKLQKKYNDVLDKRFINTHSNLTYGVFAEILEVIGVENKFTLEEKYINNILLKNRNSIAHGERKPLDAQDLMNILDRVDRIMSKFRDEILDYADKELYLNKNENLMNE
jgi:hypothetical protein